MFVDASHKEQAVRAALANPAVSVAVLKSVRRAVASYESVVRRYPTSSYSDDALWQAARLALDVFGKFGDVQDRQTGLRLLRWLTAEYPTSKLAKQVPGLLAATEGAAKDAGNRRPQQVSGGAAVPGTIDTGNGLPTAPTGRNSLQAASHTPGGNPSTIAAPKTTSLTKIQRSLLPDVVRVTIALDGEVAFHDERIAGPSRIFIDFPATRAAASLLDRTLRFDEDRDLVRQVRIGSQPNAATRIVLDAAGISSYSVCPIYNPYRLVIDCVRAIPTTSPPANSAAAAVGHRPPAAPSVRANLSGAAEPSRSTLPIAGRRIVTMRPDILPSATPGATAILAAARVPTTLTSRTVSNDWGRRLPNGSPAATAAILDATRVATLTSRAVGSNWGRRLPDASPAATAAILRRDAGGGHADES